MNHSRYSNKLSSQIGDIDGIPDREIKSKRYRQLTSDSRASLLQPPITIVDLATYNKNAFCLFHVQRTYALLLLRGDGGDSGDSGGGGGPL